MAKQDLDKLEEMWKTSTQVVAWYAHGTGDGYHPGKASVRGPYFRWFLVEPGDDQGIGNLSSQEADAQYAAAAMNSVPALIAEIRELRDKNKILNTISSYSKHYMHTCYWLENEDKWTCNCGLLRHREALAKLEAMRPGG